MRQFPVCAHCAAILWQPCAGMECKSPVDHHIKVTMFPNWNVIHVTDLQGIRREEP